MELLEPKGMPLSQAECVRVPVLKSVIAVVVDD
jgi:hypothetical protein